MIVRGQVQVLLPLLLGTMGALQSSPVHREYAELAEKTGCEWLVLPACLLRGVKTTKVASLWSERGNPPTFRSGQVTHGANLVALSTANE